MSTELSLTIIVAVIEIASILIKKFVPSWSKAIPAVNVVIGFVGSFIFKVDLLASMSASGIAMAGYDLVHGIYKAIKEYKKSE